MEELEQLTDEEDLHDFREDEMQGKLADYKKDGKKQKDEEIEEAFTRVSSHAEAVAIAFNKF